MLYNFEIFKFFLYMFIFINFSQYNVKLEPDLHLGLRSLAQGWSYLGVYSI